MTFGSLVVKNMLRSKRRTFLTAASIFVSVFLLATLLSVLRELTTPVETSASVRRLISRHKAGLTNPLPRRYLDQVKLIPNVQYVAPFTWFGGVYIDESKFFPRFATDQDLLFKMMSEATIDPQVLAQFQRKKNAAVIGNATARKYDLKPGSMMRIEGDIYPVTLELEVVGTFEFKGLEEVDDRLFFRQDYLDDLLGEGESGTIGTIWLVASDEKVIDKVIADIDGRFANTEAETLTQTEKQFSLSFLEMVGNVKVLIGSICTVVVATLFIVVASTIAITIRERTAEIAVLKTLGMRRGQIFSLLVAESVSIALLGGASAILAARGLFGSVNVNQLTGGMLFKLEVNPSIIALSLLVTIGIGFFSCLLPAWTAARMSVLDGLRALE